MDRPSALLTAACTPSSQILPSGLRDGKAIQNRAVISHLNILVAPSPEKAHCTGCDSAHFVESLHPCYMTTTVSLCVLLITAPVLSNDARVWPFQPREHLSCRVSILARRHPFEASLHPRAMAGCCG